MREEVSPATKRRYPFTMICGVYRLARSSGYAAACERPTAFTRGPKPVVSDEVLREHIRREIESCPFVSEGHRKVHCRLNKRGIVVGRGRVLRLMRNAHLLVPQRTRRTHGNSAHDGTIVTKRSNQMWGTDGTRFYTRRDGWCWFFAAIDHASDKIVGQHVAKIGDRFAALEPIKQGIVENFGGYAGAIASGLKLRLDWGTQYTSHVFEGETRWLGIELSHSFVAEPQCNGVAERFMRTVKEECLWLYDFEDIGQAHTQITAFIELYNREWLIERLGYRTPAVAHRELLQEAA